MDLRLRSAVWFAVTGLSALVVHARVLEYPLIQDDWIRLGWVLVPDPIQMLIAEFSPVDKAEYRPLGAFYFLLIAHVFKLNAVFTHAVALAVHVVNALLVGLVLSRLTGDRLIGWAGGALYGAAVLIHMESLLWASGIFDLGSACFAFLAVWLFMNGRIGWSVMAYATALLFKESVMFLPAVLAVIGWTAADRPVDVRTRILKLIRQIWPHALVFGLHFCLKLAGQSPLQHPDSHPYALRFTGPHVLANLGTYCRWIVGALFPTHAISAGTAAGVLIGLVVLVLLLARRARGQAGFERMAVAPCVVIVWLVGGVGLIPFLPNHVYKHYLTMALPAFIGVALIALRLACARAGLREQAVTTVFAALVGACVVSSTIYFRVIDGRGLNQPFIEGTNDLIRRGATVLAARDGLLRAHPSLPSRSVLLFKGLDVWAFGKDAGPRIWYDDPTIRVYDARFLERDSSGWVLRDPIESQVETYTGADSRRILLNCCPVFLFELAESGLVERRLEVMPIGVERQR